MCFEVDSKYQTASPSADRMLLRTLRQESTFSSTVRRKRFKRED